MQQWLLDNMLNALVLIIGAIIVYVKQGQFQTEALKWRGEFTKALDKMEGEVKRHIESPTPHIVCPAHGAILSEIRNVLNSIQDRITAVDNRMFGRMNELEERIFQVIHKERDK